MKNKNNYIVENTRNDSKEEKRNNQQVNQSKNKNGLEFKIEDITPIYNIDFISFEKIRLDNQLPVKKECYICKQKFDNDEKNFCTCQINHAFEMVHSDCLKDVV